MNPSFATFQDRKITVSIDCEQALCFEGETVLSVLLAMGLKGISLNDNGAVSGAYCGIGVCHCCTVEIDGVGKQRACLRVVRDRMTIRTKKNTNFPQGQS